MAVRVRFCPSPTGFLHVGSVRTALYNWLHARHEGGTAILRIEDTDQARETQGAIEQIQRSLDWLGLEFDESPRLGGPAAPYMQSERFARHRELVERLVADGLAYPCYQTPDGARCRPRGGARDRRPGVADARAPRADTRAGRAVRRRRPPARDPLPHAGRRRDRDRRPRPRQRALGAPSPRRPRAAARRRRRRPTSSRTRWTTSSRA